MTLPVGLIDTNILIDLSHNYAPALQWATRNPDLALAMPSLVRMEMVMGAVDKVDLARLMRLMRPFPVVYPTDIDAKWAMEQFETYYLSHQIEVIDCLIAAMSYRLQLPIYTRNIRDYSVFGGVATVLPY
jgi:predicted nucleic acid-binding protein